jgi:hypothetical protein
MGNFDQLGTELSPVSVQEETWTLHNTAAINVVLNSNAGFKTSSIFSMSGALYSTKSKTRCNRPCLGNEKRPADLHHDSCDSEDSEDENLMSARSADSIQLGSKELARLMIGRS